VRQNALKHGLTAETLVVDGEDAQEFQLMLDAHLDAFRPRNTVELELAKTFTLAAWRRSRCLSAETSMANQSIHDTQAKQEATELNDVLALGKQLFHDSQELWQRFPDRAEHGAIVRRRETVPGDPDLPVRLVAQLESTYKGCCWLLERWHELDRCRALPTGWQAIDKFKVIRLLGKQPLDVLDDVPGDLVDIFLATCPLDASFQHAFRELRCEVSEDEYPVILERLH
jgi:hypothetical protein